jgi:hypothetical protein
MLIRFDAAEHLFRYTKLCDNAICGRCEMRRLLNFAAGAICGAAIGAAVGLLLAPMAGDELRNTATERILAFRDEIQKAYETRRIQLEAELETLRS